MDACLTVEIFFFVLIFYIFCMIEVPAVVAAFNRHVNQETGDVIQVSFEDEIKEKKKNNKIVGDNQKN